MKEKNSEEKLPNIYSSMNNNYSQTRQSILRRNEIIDEYLLSLEKKGNNINEMSLTSEEDDDKDPFSSKAIKNLKPIKKDKNKLILPNFAKREKLISDTSSRIKNHNSNNNSNNTIKQYKEKNDLNDKSTHTHSKMSKIKNYSENNIYGNNNNYLTKFLNNNNSNLNSKWTTSSTYNNYINFSNNNTLLKNQNNNKLSSNNSNNSNSTGKETNGRSMSHIGNKHSYNLYCDKHNNSHRINRKKKYVSTQIELIPKNSNNGNNLKDYRRNFTAKIIGNKKIAILENNKQNKKNGKTRVYSTLNTRKIVENKHQIYEKLVNEKNNPYGLGWINKMLGKNNEEKVGMTKGFVNGVPVVKILSKGELSKREIKKRLSEKKKMKKDEESKINKITKAEAKLNDKDLDDEYNIPKDILEQFNKNTKNFFKIRKDIIEQPEEEEEQAIEK